MKTKHNLSDLGPRHGRGQLLGVALITLVLCGNALADLIVGSDVTNTYPVANQAFTEKQAAFGRRACPESLLVSEGLKRP